MDLRYAHGFFEVAKTLHFAKAANNMMIAPSALTRQIRLFEDSIGENLLIRTNRKLGTMGRPNTQHPNTQILERQICAREGGRSATRPTVEAHTSRVPVLDLFMVFIVGDLGNG